MSVCALSLAIFFFPGTTYDRLVCRRRPVAQILRSAPVAQTVPARHVRPAIAPSVFEPVKLLAGDMLLSACTPLYGSLATAAPRCADRQGHQPFRIAYIVVNSCTHLSFGTGTKRRLP